MAAGALLKKYRIHGSNYFREITKHCTLKETVLID